MRIENGRIVLERHTCRACYGQGTLPVRKACGTCNGTGKGVRGGRDGCRTCHGMRTVYDQNDRVTCTHCGGQPENADPEGMTDYLPRGAAAVIPIHVVRQDRGASFNESMIGHGMVYSCVDYGRAWDATDAAVWDDVHAHIVGDAIQACKIARDDGTVASALVVVVTRGGYSVRAQYADNDAERDASGELSYAEGMTFGTAVASAGGNGTMAAALARRTIG